MNIAGVMRGSSRLVCTGSRCRSPEGVAGRSSNARVSVSRSQQALSAADNDPGLSSATFDAVNGAAAQRLICEVFIAGGKDSVGVTRDDHAVPTSLFFRLELSIAK